MRKSLLVLAILGMMVVEIGVYALAQEERTEEELLFMNLEVITASKFVEKLSDAPGVISVVTKDELERFGGTTLKDILERVPGLVGSTIYMTDRTVMAARGDLFKDSGSHVLLLINGRPVRELQEGGIKSEMLESFPVNIIERIEVIRGPGSVLYGSEAFSGVINVITEKAEENGITINGLGRVPSAYGTSGEAKYRNGDLSIVAAGRYHKKPDWKVTWDYELINIETGAIVGAGSQKVTMPNKGPGSYLEVNYKNFKFMGSYNQWDNYYLLPDYMLTTSLLYGNAISYGKAGWKKGFGDLGYRLKVNEKWNMDFHTTYTRSNFIVSSWPFIERNCYEAIAEWTNFYNPIEKLGIVFGGLYNYISGTEDMKGLGRVSDGSWSGFAFYTQADYWLRQDMKLIGGLQANKVKDIDLDIVPRAGLILYPLSNVNIKTLYSEAFRAPSINEFGIHHPAISGNPDIKSEKIRTIDIGVNYVGERIQGGVNYFFNKQTGIIFQNRTAVPVFYDNIGEIEHQGVELEGKYYATRSLFLTGSALYQTNKDKEGNKNVSPIANFGAKAGISYQSSEKGVTVSLFNIYQGDLDKRYDTKLNPSPGAYNLMNLHCRLDMNKVTGWNIGRSLSLLLQVDNLFDKEFWLPDWGLLDGNSIPVNQGRTIYFGMEVSL